MGEPGKCFSHSPGSLSLNHLAHGVRIVTGCEPWEATAMAIGLYLLIVGLECAMLVTAGTRAYKPVARFANTTAS